MTEDDPPVSRAFQIVAQPVQRAVNEKLLTVRPLLAVKAFQQVFVPERTGLLRKDFRFLAQAVVHPHAEGYTYIGQKTRRA